MEKYVVSRELSEKLKAAGYPQMTVHYWHPKLTDGGLDSWSGGDDAVAAPLSDELLEQLPMIDNGYFPHLFKPNRAEPTSKWCANYYTGNHILHHVEAAKPADALAGLWLFCKENGHVS